MDIVNELAKFNHIKFYDEKHKYFIGEKEMVSTTKLISKYKQPFDSDYWSKKKADERGITKEEILKEWKYKSDFSCEKGTAFHEYAENYLNNKIFPYPYDRIKKVLGENDVKKDYDILVKQFDKFYEDSYGKLLPVKSELIVGDEELGICGMVDQLFFNEKSGNIEIWDWKTNKDIKTGNRWQQFLEPLNHLDVCELNTYSLQLSIYKYIIEKNTDLKLGDCYIAWFNQKNETYKIYKCFDFRKEIIKILERNSND